MTDNRPCIAMPPAELPAVILPWFASQKPDVRAVAEAIQTNTVRQHLGLGDAPRTA